MSTDSLQAMIEPKSIAIIGASNDPTKISGRPIEYFKRYGYEGNVIPINPKYKEIQGYNCYSSILMVDEDVDLAIIALPKKMVIQTIEECIEKQVKSIIIFSSGFAELGDEGREIQNKIQKMVSKENIRVVGPNCQGIVNFKLKSMATFSTAFAEGELMLGSSAIISQSGAVAAMIYNIQKDYGSGVKYLAATGNESDVSVSDLVHKVVEDEEVKVVQLYFEDVKNSKTLKRAAEKAKELGKPLLALKSGRTEEGQQAANSHTGALAGEDLVYDAFFQHYGVVRVDNIIELAAFSQIFQLEKEPENNRVAIISNSGGLGVMMVDYCKEMDLEIAQFAQETINKLHEILPVFASVNNPIDITAQLLNDKNLFSSTLPILLNDPNVDIILFALGTVGKGYDVPSIIRDISKAQRSGNKIMAVSWVGSRNNWIPEFGKNGIPAFTDPMLCVKAVSKYVEYHRYVINNEKTSENPIVDVQSLIKSLGRGGDQKFLSEHNSKEILRGLDFPLAKEELVSNENDAVKAAERIGYPVVLKVSSAKIIHKTEAGVVSINLQNKNELLHAYKKIKTNCEKIVEQSETDGFLVQKMIRSGFEISLGYKKDPVFGSVIMIGSGGIYIEVLKDFKLAVPPIDYNRAMQIVNSLKMSPLLKGVRGKEKLDIKALCQLIVSFSQFIENSNELIDEIDLNPVIVLPEGDGVKIVDALMKLK